MLKTDRLVDLLVEQNGGPLDLERKVYYLFLNDSVVCVKLSDDDTDTLNISVQINLNRAVVYHADDWVIETNSWLKTGE